MRRAWILGLSLFGCGWPDGLPETASPGRMRGGPAYPDLRATAAPRGEGRRDAAIIIAIEDYTTLADRPGAHAMAAAWYRYIRETRRVRPSRIKLLRDGEATREAIARALKKAHDNVGRKGTVWFVFVGHISGTLPGKYGALWLQAGDGTPATLQDQAFSAAVVLSRLGHGLHPRAIAVFDGCLTGGPRSPALRQRDARAAGVGQPRRDRRHPGGPGGAAARPVEPGQRDVDRPDQDPRSTSPAAAASPPMSPCSRPATAPAAPRTCPARSSPRSRISCSGVCAAGPTATTTATSARSS